MKKEGLQDSQQGTGIAENESQDPQKNPIANVSIGQSENMTHRAGLGRDRMTDIEELEDMGKDNDHQNTNEPGGR